MAIVLRPRTVPAGELRRRRTQGAHRVSRRPSNAQGDAGSVYAGEGTRIHEGAHIEGPVVPGRDERIHEGATIVGPPRSATAPRVARDEPLRDLRLAVGRPERAGLALVPAAARALRGARRHRRRRARARRARRLERAGLRVLRPLRDRHRQRRGTQSRKPVLRAAQILGGLGVEQVALKAYFDAGKVRTFGDRHLQQLTSVVTSLKANLGVLIDADGETVTLVDDAGTIVGRNRLMALHATRPKRRSTCGPKARRTNKPRTRGRDRAARARYRSGLAHAVAPATCTARSPSKRDMSHFERNGTKVTKRQQVDFCRSAIRLRPALV